MIGSQYPDLALINYIHFEINCDSCNMTGPNSMFSALIMSVMKSLVIPAMWLAPNSMILALIISILKSLVIPVIWTFSL